MFQLFTKNVSNLFCSNLKLAKPEIIGVEMKDQTRPESLEVSYIVKGTGNPCPKAIWTLNGKEVKPDDHVKITSQGQEHKLEILKLKMGDAGTYVCTLSNLLGSVKQQAVLDVTRKLILTT